LELIVSESVVAGVLEQEEHVLFKNIFDFAERRISQVMVPRVRIEAIPVDIGEAELIDTVVRSNHSRFPVYERNIDDILGVLHLKDLVHQQLEKQPFELRAMLRKAPEVPETMHAETLLALMKRQHVHMAVVLDEYGGTSGIVTLEDLVEEVVGEVRDEFDVNEEPPVTVLGPGHLSVRGGVPLDDIEEYVALGETEHDVESVGGLVMAELNRPPAIGDEVQIDDVVFRIEAVDGFSIERLTIVFQPRADGETG
jgi:CBS domain containing-hemolysin-like protein